MLSLLDSIFTGQLGSILASEIPYKAAGDMEDASILPMSLVLLKMQALEASKSFLTRIARNGIPCELEENVPVEKLFSGSALAEHEVEWAAEDQLDEV